MIEFPKTRSSRRLLLTSVSFAAIMMAYPASAQVVRGLHGASGNPIASGTPTPSPASAPGGIPAGAALTPQQAQARTTQATNDLASALARIKTQMDTQAAARSAAQAASSNIPNGVTAGGLLPAAGISTDSTLWQYANLPTQTTDGGKTTVTVKQTAPSAILNWQTFNVGKDTTLYFDQSSGTDAQGKNGWVALNRVTDPSAHPTEILGAIKAEGSVYVINPNGVIFGNSSQVNVHSLIASALYLYDTDRHVSDNKFLQGINAANLAAGTGSQALYNPQLLVSATDPVTGAPILSGDVTIDAGAQIETGKQGIALIAGTNVTNNGQIVADDGQALLVAGSGLWLGGYGNHLAQYAAPAFADGNPIADPQLTVDMTIIPDGFGHIINTGVIQSKRGTIDILGGGEVDQQGVLLSSTGTAHTGTIRIDASDGYFNRTSAGAVYFADQSLTTVLADDSGTTLPSDAQSLANFVPGSIVVNGQGIDAQSGSLLYAPGQTITLGLTQSNVNAGGHTRVLLEDNAIVDVAGLSDIEVPISDTIVTVPRVGLNELADDPLLKNGFLYKNSITVDVTQSGVTANGVPWVGTPLADLQGYAAQVQKGVGQLLSNGGTINIGQPSFTPQSGFPTGPVAANEFVSMPGSIMNLSGGYVHYTGGYVQTTKLLGVDGRIYDISKADPSQSYIGFAGTTVENHQRWVVSDTFSSGFFNSPTYEGDFVQGGNAGSLQIYARGISLGGTVLASAVAGAHQVANSAPPMGGTLTLLSYSSLDLEKLAPALPSDFSFDSPLLSQTTTLLVNANSGSLDDLDDSYSVVSTDALSDAGFSNLYLGKVPGGNPQNTTPLGAFKMAQDASLTVQPGGIISIGAGGLMDVEGQLHAAGGQIVIESLGVLGDHMVYQPGLEDITIGANAVLDVRGRWVNDYIAQQTGGPLLGGAYINGGSVSIISDASTADTHQYLGFPLTAVSGYNTTINIPNPTVHLDITGSINVAEGAVIDLTSGGWVKPTGGFQGGKGGSLSLSTYNNANYVTYYTPNGGGDPPPAVDALFDPFDAPVQGKINFDGTLLADSFAGGGTLSIQAPSIRIGGDPSGVDGEFYIPETLFTNGDGIGETADRGDAGGMFGSYAFTSTYGGISVAPGTTIALKQQNMRPTAATFALATGGDVYARDANGQPIDPLVLLPDISRQPVNLSLTSKETYNFHVDQVLYQSVRYTNGVPADQFGHVYQLPHPDYIADADAAFGIDRPVEYAPGADPNIYIGSETDTTPVEILADPKASINVTGDTDVLIRADIKAAGGSVTFASGRNPDTVLVPTYYGNGTDTVGGDLWLLAGSTIDLSGAVIVDTTKPDGSQIGKSQAGQGKVIAGGSFTVTAPTFVAEQGTLIDISGASGTLNMPVATDGDATAAVLAPMPVWSDAGSITLNIGDSNSNSISGNSGTLLLDGTIQGFAGHGADPSQHGAGGSLTLTVGGYNSGPPVYILIQQNGSVIPDGLHFGDDIPTSVLGTSALSADMLAASGLDNLTLVGPVALKGDVDLRMNGSITFRDVHQIYLVPADGAPVDENGIPTGSVATVSAPYIGFVATTTAYPSAPVPQPQTLNGGTLNFVADAIDIFNSETFGNGGAVNFNSAGDIRLGTYVGGYSQYNSSLPVSVMTAQGDITFTSAQLYPISGVTYNLVSTGENATIAFESNGNSSAPPLSAGGTLDVSAANIVQNGVVRAPFGTIDFGYAYPTYNSQNQPITISTDNLTLGEGSITSVSGAGLEVPYGTTVDQLDWYYYNRSQLSLTAPPQKVLELSAAHVVVAPGATVDLSGGGDLYAQEFVQGTGGSRDVLSRYTNNGVTGNPSGGASRLDPYSNTSQPQYYQYADGRDVYAIIPGVQPVLASTDPDFTIFYNDGSTIKPGMSVYLSGTAGLPAGYYTLLPGHYATMPGAYRVVLANSSNTFTSANNAVMEDGTRIVAGYAANNLTGASSSGMQLFSLQSQDVWSQYSEYKITSANEFFPSVAAKKGLAVPRLPVDAGKVVLSAQISLSIGSEFTTDAAEGGRGAVADVTGAKIEITAPGETADDGYVAFDALSLDALNASSLLIGGTRAAQDTTTLVNGDPVDTLVITPTATNIIVANDANSALKAPEILFAVAPGLTEVDPTVDQSGIYAGSYYPFVEFTTPSSITVRSGAVIEATGDVTGQQPSIIQFGLTGLYNTYYGTTTPLSFYLPTSDGHGGYVTDSATFQTMAGILGSGAGSFLRVSNGAQVQVNRVSVDLPGYPSTVHLSDYGIDVYLPTSAPSNINIDPNVVLSGDGSITVDTTGDASLSPSTTLKSSDLSLSAGSIAFDQTGSAPASGLVLSPELLAQLTSAAALRFHSYGAIDFYGDVSLVGSAARIQTLSLDAQQLRNHGGNITVDAANVVVSDSSPADIAGIPVASGSLTVTSDSLSFGGGDVRLTGFETVALGGENGISLAHSGSLNAETADLTLNTPLLLALSGSNQNILTTGAIVVKTPDGKTAAPAPQQISSDSSDDQPGGILTITAASIQSDGAIQALAGLASLHATTGDISLTGGGVYAGGYGQQFFDVIKYAPGGYLTLTADHGNVITRNDATLDVSASALGGDAGSVLIYAPTGTADLGGKLTGIAAQGALGANFSLDVGQAVDLDPLAQRLTDGGFTGALDIRTGAGDLDLSQTLKGSNVSITADGGTINVSGTVDASGDHGGMISLYGSDGVHLTSAAQLIAQPTNPAKLGGDIYLGTAATGVNGVNASDGSETVTTSGTIDVASGAVLDVSGGTNEGVTGGTVHLRAPILQNGTVNVSFDGTVIGARSKTLEAYRTWATSDGSTGAKHFDGIVDPAGFFNAADQRVDGVWYGYTLDPNYVGTGYKIYQYDPTTYLNISGQIGTEVNGVRYDMDGNVVADDTDGFFVANGGAIDTAHRDFYQGTLMQFVQSPGVTGPAGFDVAPGVELKNDTLAVNNGDIIVASNWNLGASGVDANGNPVPFYRNGQVPGVLTLRALRDVDVKASVTDGFFQAANTMDSTYITALNDYFDNARNPGTYMGQVTYTYSDGSTYTYDTAISSSFIGAPDAPALHYDTSDAAYNAAADTYYNTEYPAYITTYVAFRNLAAKPGETPQAVPGYTAPTAPNRSSFGSYADYLNAYNTQYLAAVQTVLAQCGGFCFAPVAPVAPTAPAVPATLASFDLSRPDAYYGANGAANNPTVNNPAPVALSDLFPLIADPNGTIVGEDGTHYRAIQSWSYRVVSGSNESSANPLRMAALENFSGDAATALTGHGDVVVSGHTEYAFPYDGPMLYSYESGARSLGLASVTPTTIRTGTGSIDIAAGRDLRMIDTLAPGVIYTAGRTSAPLNNPDYSAVVITNSNSYSTISNFTPADPTGFYQLSGPLSYPGCNAYVQDCGQTFIYGTPAYPDAGGNLTITAQQDIQGFQNVVDVNRNLLPSDAFGYYGSQTSLIAIWGDWLLNTGTAAVDAQGVPSDTNGLYNPNFIPAYGNRIVGQPAWWVNFASFDQGVGALGGGNVTIIAGGDVSQLGVSLPMTAQISGGLTYSLPDGSRNLPQIHEHGGGDLLLRARGDLLSGTILIGKGDGVVSVGGAVESGIDLPSDPYVGGGGPLPISIGFQDGQLRIVASGSVTIGKVASPTMVGSGADFLPYVVDPLLVQQPTNGNSEYGDQLLFNPVSAYNPGVSTYSPNSSLSVTSAGGDVNFDTLAQNDVVTASLDLTSLRGDINLPTEISLTPSDTGTLSMTAGHNIYLGYFDENGVPQQNNGVGLDTGDSVILTSFDPKRLLLGYNSPVGGQILLHADDTVPDRIYALNDIQSSYAPVSLTKHADIRAGRDILSLTLNAQNIAESDVTNVVAGRDIIRVQISGGNNGISTVGNNLTLAGPGIFDVEAGRDLGPFVPAGQYATQPSGIVTIGNFDNPLLPAESAQIIALAGIANGVNYQGMIDRYIDPAQISSDAQNYLPQLATYENTLGYDDVTTTGDAWNLFQTLTPFQQHIFLSEIFFAELKTGATANPNYSRGYTAVNTMFPASMGYTQNNLGGGTNGANTLVQTGNIDLRQSTIQTQEGGNISLFTPGGEILVGSQSASPSQSNPAFTGIITLAGGNIYTFSDESVLVNQSRVFTEQGGEIEMFTSNGDLDAGRGSKTTSSLPPAIYICDALGYCYKDPRGLVTGAGIATLQSIEGAPPGNVDLLAPRGTVNAGDAGIRVSGDLVIAALHVLNADNIQVKGKAIGLPPKPVTNLTLTTSSNTSNEAAALMQSLAIKKPSLLSVEVTGFGGENSNSPEVCIKSAHNSCSE